MSKEINRYDERGNQVYWKGSYEYWSEYDKNNNLIYYKNTEGYEGWYKWENNNQIIITEKEYKEIEFRKKEKEYLSREKVSRFELIDI